jgi:hypothetical protein
MPRRWVVLCGGDAMLMSAMMVPLNAVDAGDSLMGEAVLMPPMSRRCWWFVDGDAVPMVPRGDSGASLHWVPSAASHIIAAAAPDQIATMVSSESRHLPATVVVVIGAAEHGHGASGDNISAICSSSSGGTKTPIKR